MPIKTSQVKQASQKVLEFEGNYTTTWMPSQFDNPSPTVAVDMNPHFGVRLHMILSGRDIPQPTFGRSSPPNGAGAIFRSRRSADQAPR